MVVFTGGTIGSRKNDDNVIKTDEAPYMLIDNYLEKSDRLRVEFYTCEPYRILSENLSADNINKLLETISSCINQNEFDGIIVTHGTDTLQYTAAALSLVFGREDIPIVLVSSNYVLGDKRANGMDNFEAAVKFVAGKYGNGVYVSYKNRGENALIHKGDRLTPSEHLSDRVKSELDEYFGEFIDDKFVYNSQFEEYDLDKISNDRLVRHAKGILRIVPYPGMTYPELTEDIRVVLHESYHSGTIAINEELKQFANAAKKKGIKIYLTGLNMKEALYETAKEYDKLGIIPIRGTAIYNYMRLWFCDK